MNIYPRMQIEVKIPEYLTIKHYLGFQHITDLTNERDVIMNTISVMTGYSVEDIRNWSIDGLVQVYKALAKVQLDTKAEFYPILEVEGTLYGFQPISKMNVGEHMDLERLAKEPQKNLTEIIAILYRPITEHKLKSLEFKVKSNIKALVGGNEHLFPYYTVEKYDATQRRIDAIKMEDFPASVALGAMSFFLLTATNSLKSIQTSSQKDLKKLMKKMSLKTKQVFNNTMDGSRQYTSLHTLPSYKSQVISQFSI
jgi:hypothetical protein